MAFRRWRPVLLKVHRWLGLSVGMLLILNALTGSMMLAARPLDRAVHSHLFVVPVPAGAQRLPLEDLRQSLVKEFGAKAGFTIRPPRESAEALLVYVRSDSWAGQAHYDPYTGKRLGVREEHEGFANTLFEFHSSLLSGDVGKQILAFNVLTMLAMLVTGLMVWWPARWRGALSVTLNRDTLRSLIDLHRLGGVVFGLWVLVCVASGTWMAWRPISQWVTQAAGQQPVVPPVVKAVSAVQPATVDQMLVTANAAMPGGIVGYVVLPAKPTAPVRIRKKLDDDPHPNGLSSVWLHPRTGEVLRAVRWTDLDIGARSTAWIYPLHAGMLAGVIGITFTAAGGFLLFGFGLTGTWVWWLKRRLKA